MTIEQCYADMGADYNDVSHRIPNAALIKKFALKFLDDQSMEQLTAALKEGDVETAFRAAHTLKGLCLTLGFSKLAKPAIELTELLRGRRMDGYESLYQEVRTSYDETVALLKQVG